MVARNRRRPERDKPDHYARIRTIFLKRRSNYSTGDVARLTGLNRDNLIRRIQDSEFDIDRVEYWLPWSELVTIALDQWPLEAIYEALGDRADEVLPRMLRLEELSVRMPVYILRMLEHVAAREKVSVAEYLQRELRDLTETEVRRDLTIEERMPGIREALLFPERQ